MATRKKRYPRTDSATEIRRAFQLMGDDLDETAGGLAAFITLVSTTYVPYTGANADVNLGTHDLTATDVTATDVHTGDLYVGGIAYIDVITSTDSLSVTNNVDMGGSYTVTNLASPVNGSDAVTLDFLTEAITEVEYTPDSLTLVTGTYVSGDVDSVKTLSDGDTYDVDEVAGVPGWDIEFDFSGISSFNRIWLHVHYQGLVAHVVNIDLWNYDTTSWDTATTFTTSNDFQFIEMEVDDTNHISSGASRLRLYHTSNGLPTHSVEVDYVALVKAGFGSANDHGALTGLGDDDHEQYSLVDGTRPFTGTVGGVTPVAGSDLATKEYVDGAGGQVEVTNDEATPIVIGTPVYVTGAGSVSMAQAVNTAKAGVFGLVKDVSIAAAGTGKVIFSGVLEATTVQWDAVTGESGGLTPKSTYYLSLTAGQLTTVPVSEVGQVCTEVGTALDTTRLKIEIRRMIEL